MSNLDDYYEFDKIFAKMTAHAPKSDCDAFAADEFKRFRSIAGTILTSFQNVDTVIDERIITHILMRSLLENYFWLLYIFDEPDRPSWDAKFDEYVNGFKIDYAKLYNEPLLPNKSNIEAPRPGWDKLKKPMDVNSLLTALKNYSGDKLNYLYFLYRITSFDTHGRSQRSLFRTAFGKDCNFPYLRIDMAINLIANQYLVIWQKISI